MSSGYSATKTLTVNTRGGWTQGRLKIAALDPGSIANNSRVALMCEWWSPPTGRFPEREPMASRRSRIFIWESIQERTRRNLCSEPSQPLTLHPNDKKVVTGLYRAF
ncbi:hypothetical protein TNCV_4898801 [Trichonephila clavipes]|nr:hypothetical protein TNCV_4898801 [Trichonephila clavipes]